ncbi:MAG TPA: hypothetical protein VFK76_04835 [Gaiellaceae bacterium]|nr:hypothetical protein [Gaiellaceae bacterium]
MQKSTLVVLIALGAAFAGFVITSVVRDLGAGTPPSDVSVAAGPQSATLGWREQYGSSGQDLVFTVDRLQVLHGGWKAEIGIANHTKNAYDVGDPRATLDRSFGLMLFSTNSESELNDRNRKGTLPPVREVVRFEPSLPKVLESGDAWEGTVWAPGALAAKSWVRVVFGPLLVIGKPAKGTASSVTWITDETHQLKS